MSRILLMLMLSVIRGQRVSTVSPCPPSCVVCSEDAIICNRLDHIIDAPHTTQALLLTEGSISTVQPDSLSDLSNITVIGLSHNHISVLGGQSFRALPFLHTLLLDHNHLTSQTLQGGALTNLTQLEVLALGHNLISMIQGDWIRGSKALRSLKLEGNLLTSLDSGSLPLNDLRYLENLDVSDNLIDHLDKESFSGLLELHTLDLSRNRLSSAPAEAFSYLSWLTNLNLDLNSWNCSCQLLELAAFLSTFIQQPDKTLYNGRRMVCVSADNPAVTTVLELTEANCVPSNQNITVQIETRASVTPQLYARNMAITAVICFIGGVGLTLLVVLVYYQVLLRKKLKESKKQKVEEEGSSIISDHHVNTGRRRDHFLQANSSQVWDREVMSMDARTEDHGHQFRGRADENGSHFLCSDCSNEGQRGMGPNPMRWNNRINTAMEEEEDIEKRRMRMMTGEERKRRLGTQQGILSRDFPTKLYSRGNFNSSSHPSRESQRSETLTAYREMGERRRTDVEVRNKGHETLHCDSCHRTYRPPEQNIRQGRIRSNMGDSAAFDGFSSQYRQTDRSMNVNHNTESRRDTRNVTFDLERLKTKEQGNGDGRANREEGDRTPGDKERGRGRTHKAKVQSSRLLRVKLNLNPLRKSKVHPKRKTEHDKSSSRKSKNKGRGGKEKEEREGKEKKTKGRSKTMHKSEENVEEAKEEKEKDKEQGGQKGKKTSKTEASGKENPGEQGEDEHPVNPAPGTAASTPHQSASAVATGQGQPLQGGRVQYVGSGLVQGSAQLSSQHPLSLPATDRTHSLSLLGSAGSQLPGRSLSLQGGNFLLNTMAPGSNALLPSYPANPIGPNVAISGPNMAPSGAAGNSRHSLTSLPVNTTHANPSPLHTAQPTELASTLTANPAGQFLSQSQLPPDCSLIATQMSDPSQGLGPQTGVHQQTPQPAQTKESLTLPPQATSNAEGFSGVSPPSPGAVTTVENLSNNNSQTEPVCVPACSTANMSARVEALTLGLAVGMLGDSMQAADVSVSGVSAPRMSGSSTGDVAMAPLLQQEYLSEEGGSSPRRKLRLVLPEKTSSRPPTALERKIR